METLFVVHRLQCCKFCNQKVIQEDESSMLSAHWIQTVLNLTQIRRKAYKTWEKLHLQP
jgi:hypothetical protein